MTATFGSLSEMRSFVEARESHADMLQAYVGCLSELLYPAIAMKRLYETAFKLRYGALILMHMLPLAETQRVYWGVQLSVVEKRWQKFIASVPAARGEQMSLSKSYWRSFQKSLRPSDPALMDLEMLKLPV
jgi:hypothetical protein